MKSRMMNINDYSHIAYTDGSSRGNPGPGGYGAIVWDTKSQTVKELGAANNHTTNNEMELYAIFVVLKTIPEKSNTIILTDSKYALNGITSWMHNWAKNDWKTKSGSTVVSKPLWQQIYQLYTQKHAQSTIQMYHVPGHAGLPGNERVDEIAHTFASQKNPNLVSKQYDEYGIDLTFSTKKIEVAKQQKKSKSSRTRAKAYSYISMINGAIQIHKRWDECHKRVKGKKARFCKTINKEDETRVIKEWKNYE